MCGFFPVHSASCCRGVPQHRRVFRSARQLAEPPLRWPEGQLQQSARASPDAQQPPASARPPDDWWQQRAWWRLLWHPCKMSSTSACFFYHFIYSSDAVESFGGIIILIWEAICFSRAHQMPQILVVACFVFLLADEVRCCWLREA